MRELLSKNNNQNLPRSIKSVPMPLDPTLSLLGLNPKTIFMFRSAMYPAVIDFNVCENQLGDILKLPSKAGSETAPTRRSSVKSEEVLNDDGTMQEAIFFNNSKVWKIIVKSGDDLRQDQLVMQLIALMDELLKKVNLDLKLLTYGILAVGPTDGIMEFVQGSMPISACLSQYGSILTYLRTHNPDSSGVLGVKATAMDMFVRSCAASCVVTYILGIGDR